MEGKKKRKIHFNFTLQKKKNYLFHRWEKKQIRKMIMAKRNKEKKEKQLFSQIEKEKKNYHGKNKTKSQQNTCFHSWKNNNNKISPCKSKEEKKRKEK